MIVRYRYHSSIVQFMGITDYCCEEMTLAFFDEFIGFGSFGDRIAYLDGDEVGLNIYRTILRLPDPSYESMHIEYCPFCGERITLEAVS